MNNKDIRPQPEITPQENLPGAKATPIVPENRLIEWQGFIDTLAEVIAVPAGLIMRIVDRDIEILVASHTAGNPHHPGERKSLVDSGLYGKTVLGDRAGLLVPDATADVHWRNDPDIKLGMISYLGFPILWPDGNPFGMICVQDRKANRYSEPQKRLMEQFRSLIEGHLGLLTEDVRGLQNVAGQRHQWDEVAQANEARSRMLMENASDDFFLHDEKGRVLDVNRQACQSLGYSRDELLKMHVTDFSVGSNRELLGQLWAGTEPGDCPIVYAEHQRKDGTIFHVEVSVSCLIAQGSKVFFTLVRNITGRVEAEHSIRQLNAELERRVIERTAQSRKSSELLQAVMDGATDVIFLQDLDGRFLLFNRAGAKFVGKPVEDVLGKTPAALFGEEVAKKIRQHELQVVQTGEASTVEERMFVHEREYIFLATRSPYRDEHGNLVGLIGIIRDITQIKSAETALRGSEARWQFAIDGSGDGIWDWNIETEKVFYSPRWKKMLGYEEDEIGQSAHEWSDRVHPEDLPVCWQIVDDNFKNHTQDFVFEHRMRSKDGLWKWILSRGKVIERTQDGRPMRVIGTHTDVTARKIAEDDFFLERERLRMAAEAGRFGVWDYNFDTNTIVCDERWHQIFGFDPAWPVTTTDRMDACIHPDDLDRVLEVRKIAPDDRQRFRRVEFRIQTPAGETRWITSAARLIEGNEHTPHRLVGLVRDITERYLAEEQLQQSYEALRQAEKLAKIGSWTLDLESQRFRSSDMLNEMNGLGPEDPPLSLDGLQKLIPPDSYRKIQAGIERCIATGTPYDVETEHFRTDGTSYAAQVRGQANQDKSGKIVSLTGTIQDISEREEARARLAALADNLPNGAIYRLEHAEDKQFLLTYVSAGIFSLVGIEAAKMLSDQRAFLAAIHEDDLPRYRASLVGSLLTGDVFDCQFRMRTPDGQWIWMHSRSAPRRQADGTTVWDGIMRDITDERQVSETLERAKETAEAAEHAKSDFLATMSHEIRTPMNTVIGMTRLALQTDLSPKQRNYLEKIDSSAKTLLSIINDVLDFSKIEAGKLGLEDVEFQLESVLESVSNVTAMQAEEKALEIAYAVDPGVPRTLRGDPLRLGQVLINLVSNAVKFTHAGEIIVTIHATEKDADRAAIQFSVRDTGIGLDALQIEGLFRAFTQADADVSRRYGGTGLGLAICKQLVEMMGGRIWVESEPGKGSTFAFTIKTLLPATAESTPDAPNHQALTGRRVLIVDDNASARQILFDMVHGFGMEPVTTESGVEALGTLQSASNRGQPFDLVLMDWRMPGMDGIETARRIKEEKELGTMPAVLMVTAYGRDEVLRSVDKLRLQGILIKPITESVMFNTIMEILGLFNTGHVKLESPKDSAARRGLMFQKKELSALKGRRVLVVDDNALNREVVSDFLIAAEMHVETAVNGRVALDQLEKTNFDVVLMDMHMPELDGLMATRQIRQNARWTDLPIIALTAQARIEDRNASLEAGMTAHLTKPIDEAVLYRTLMDVLESTSARPPSSASAADLAPSSSNGPDIQAALRRLGGNQDRLKRLLNGFLGEYADASERMQEYLEKGQLAEMSALAHLVKGAASYFDAHQLCATAEQLETFSRRGDHQQVAHCAPAFRSSLEALLEYLKVSAAGLPGPETGSASMDPGIVLQLIERAEPLVMNGDYAALSVLEQICAGLVGHRAVLFAETARSHFDELELQAARDALQRLTMELKAQNQGGIRL
jgi:two-component system, sensor histidine kinase and response regulator